MNNIRNWLLEDETQEVKYRAMTELLCMKKDDPEVIKAYNSLLVSDTVSLIMDKFKTNNKWEDINAFCILAEIGLTHEDISIDGYLERMLMYGKEASNRKQEIDRQHHTIPKQKPKDKHYGNVHNRLFRHG